MRIAGGHNVVSGILDFLQRYHPGSKLLGFRKGPIGIMSGDAVEITLDAMVSCVPRAPLPGLPQADETARPHQQEPPY